MTGGYKPPWPFDYTGVVACIRHVVILSGQLTVVKDNGECWTLGREGGMSNAPLEWQQLPTVPGFGGATESSAL
jgi:hypothetical protein